MTEFDAENICKSFFAFLPANGFIEYPVKSEMNGMLLIKTFSLDRLIISISFEAEGYVNLMISFMGKKYFNIESFLESIGIKHGINTASMREYSAVELISKEIKNHIIGNIELVFSFNKN